MDQLVVSLDNTRKEGGGDSFEDRLICVFN